MPTTGVSVAAAMCSGPVSPPTNSRLRPINALSSCRSNSPRSTIRSAAAPSRPRASAAIRDAASRSDGPELNTSRRRGRPRRQRRGGLRETLRASAGTGCPRSRGARSARRRPPTPARASRAAIAWSAAGSSAISTRSRAGSRRSARPPRDRLQQIPLVGDRVPRAQLARPRHHPRVHPAPALDVVADARPRRRSPRPATRCAGRRAGPARDRTVPAAAGAPAPDRRRSAASRACAAPRSPRRDAD